MGVYIAVHCNFNRQSVLYIYIYTIEYRISRLANLDRSIDRLLLMQILFHLVISLSRSRRGRVERMEDIFVDILLRGE